MSSKEKHYFVSRVETKEPLNRDLLEELEIHIFLYKETRSWYDYRGCVNSRAPMAELKFLRIPLSCPDHRRMHTAFISSHLSRMGVPQEEHPIILDKLFKGAVPGRRSIVLLADITARLLGSFDDHDHIDRIIRERPRVDLRWGYPRFNELFGETFEFRDVDCHPTTITDWATRPLELFETRRVRSVPATDTDWARLQIDRLMLESFETQRVRFVPASRSAIESLKRVRLDQAIIKQNPTCSICRDEFANQLILALPCAHNYHARCIIQWLEINHLCPLCRYSLPVEDGHPSNS